MESFSYIVKRDFGFAPNPFHGFCTLATCKPRIRNSAEIGDWIFGLSPKPENKLIYAMKVTDKITYDEYWQNPQYQCKKPALNGSTMVMYGDNIYHTDKKTGAWQQADSHHSYENGVTNFDNLNRDTKSEYVLISDDFYYFGKECIDIPFNLKDEFSIGIGHKRVNSDVANEVINYLREQKYDSQVIGFPTSSSKFQRYDGK